VIRLAVRVRREDAELALAELLDLAPSGVEETELEDGAIEFAVYGSPGELPRLPELRAAVGDALVEVATSELPDDWAERWRRFHRPTLIEPLGRARVAVHAGEEGVGATRADVAHAGGVGVGATRAEAVPGLYIRPPWEPPSRRPDVEEIVIDPGQAFGTGAHPTTRMCLELLLELAAEKAARGPLLDVGVGSGVLAIAATRLGYAPVVGLDNELASVRAARENAKVNGMQLEVRSFDLRREPLPSLAGDAPPTVIANLLRPLLIDLARSLERTVANPADTPPDLIVGGLLTAQVDEVVRVFVERLPMRERLRRASGEWAAAWLTQGPAVTASGPWSPENGPRRGLRGAGDR
jgi:ribosomal protein L11 methyltransferase